jgi:hypothetical protein
MTVKKYKRKQCGKKVGHKTMEGAFVQIKKMSKKNFTFHKLKPYKCKHCGLWHIGRTKQIDYNKFSRLIDGKYS